MLVAHVWLVAVRRLECKAPSNQNVRYLYLPSLDLMQREIQWCFGWYHQEPCIIQPGAYGVYIKVLDTTKQQRKQTYRLRNVRAGYVLYRALVVAISQIIQIWLGQSWFSSEAWVPSSINFAQYAGWPWQTWNFGQAIVLSLSSYPVIRVAYCMP